jgi:hypothetical protein
MASPRVSVRIGAESFEAEARVVEPDTEEDVRARRLLATKYQGWEEGRDLSDWARTALPIAMTPP